MSHTTLRIWNAHAKIILCWLKVSVTGELYLKRYDSLDSTISKSESNVDKETILSFENYKNFEIHSKNFICQKKVQDIPKTYFCLK